MSNDPLANALASLYLTFAHATDGDLTAEEMRTLASKLQKRAPNMPLDELGQLLRSTVSAYKSLGSHDEKMARARADVELLRDSCPEKMRGAIVADLAEIAAADGNVADEERAFIEEMAQTLGVPAPE